MRLQVAGLDLELDAGGEGALALLARLAVFAPLPVFPLGAAPAAPLRLRLRGQAGFPATFDRLAVRRLGLELGGPVAGAELASAELASAELASAELASAEFSCAGDGVRGTIGAREGSLEVHGGEAALVAALRLACALWLLPRSGLLLHGACIEAGGAAHAFLGPSGAGKTTLAFRLAAAGLRVVGDEVVAVRSGRAQASPFQSRLGDGRLPPQGVPLGSISFLSHAGADPSRAGADPSHGGADPSHGGAGLPARQRLSPAQAARALLGRVFLPARDAATLHAALETCAQLAGTVPAFALRLPDDASAVDWALGNQSQGSAGGSEAAR